MKQLFVNTPKLTDPISGLIVSLLLIIFGAETAQAQSAGMGVIEGTGVIVDVVDGDTARVQMYSSYPVEAAKLQAQKAERRYQRNYDLARIYQLNGPTTATMLIRVANIDTAESVHPDAHKNSQAGRKASDYASTAFSGERVDVACYDVGYYGRPICDIQSQGGDWAEVMIKAGYTKYETEYGRHPVPFRHKRLVNAQENAFKN